MRLATLAAALTAAAAVAQPPLPGPPAAPPALPTQPPPPPPANPRLEGHLTGWQQSMAGLNNFSAKFDLVRTDTAFKKDTHYEGSVLCMKPNLAYLQVVSKADKGDYETFLCDGRAVFKYDGPKKTVYEMRLAPGAGADNLMLDFLGGMKANDARTRFDIGLFNEDPNYVYLDIKPRLAKDRQDFKHARLALLAPTNAAKLPAYLPKQVWLMQPNDNTEMWSLKDHVANHPGVQAAMFQFKKPDGWKHELAPPAGPPGVPPPAVAPPGLPPAAPPGAAPGRP